MLYPVRNAENSAIDQEFPDRLFFRGCVRNPLVHVLRDLERGHIFVPVLFERLKGNGAIPFLLAHGEDLIRAKWIKSHVLEKKHVSLPAERRLLWQRGQFVPKNFLE